jgi:transposase
MQLDIALSFQEAVLAGFIESREPLGDDAWIKREFCYYKIIYNLATRAVESYVRNENKISKARNLSGFFAIMTHGVDYDAMAAFRAYRLRDEQEKYFQQMKDQMASDRQRNWSEEGKAGRLFILFVSLVLSSYVRHIWKSTRLHELFPSSLDVVDEMRPIRLIEHTNRTKVITPFVGAQVDICAAFDFEIP